MTTKRSLKNDVGRLKETTETEDNRVVYFKHDETGELYDADKTLVEDPDCPVIAVPFHLAPFVAEREFAEAEGWPIIRPVETRSEAPYTDMVEVAEWESREVDR